MFNSISNQFRFKKRAQQAFIRGLKHAFSRLSPNSHRAKWPKPLPKPFLSRLPTAPPLQHSQESAQQQHRQQPAQNVFILFTFEDLLFTGQALGTSLSAFQGLEASVQKRRCRAHLRLLRLAWRSLKACPKACPRCSPRCQPPHHCRRRTSTGERSIEID